MFGHQSAVLWINSTLVRTPLHDPSQLDFDRNSAQRNVYLDRLQSVYSQRNCQTGVQSSQRPNHTTVAWPYWLRVPERRQFPSGCPGVPLPQWDCFRLYIRRDMRRAYDWLGIGIVELTDRATAIPQQRPRFQLRSCRMEPAGITAAPFLSKTTSMLTYKQL